MQAWRETTRYSMRALAQQELNAETAHLLLLDTSLRLQGQATLLERVKEESSRSQDDTNNPQNPGVIRAATTSSVSANLLDWKGHLEREKALQTALHQSHRMLENVSRLHRDTLNLTTELLNTGKIWSEFSTAHQNLIAATLEQIRSRHATTLETIADWVILLRNARGSPTSFESLTPFLRGRLAVQILCDQYIALKRGRSSVSLDCPLRVVLEEAKTEAAMLCDAHYQSSPEVALPGQDIPNITLVRPWIHHALVEVLKNAMVSSMKVAEREDTAPPLIQVEIVKDPDFVSILVRDGGTGLADPSRAFTFASSSADQRWDRLDVQQSYAAVRSPLQSLGVGVPCSLWLLQHFGGKLKLANNRGQGCTATLSLPRNDTIPEYLPIDDDDYLLCTDAPS